MLIYSLLFSVLFNFYRHNYSRKTGWDLNHTCHPKQNEVFLWEIMFSLNKMITYFINLKWKEFAMVLSFLNMFALWIILKCVWFKSSLRKQIYLNNCKLNKEGSELLWITGFEEPIIIYNENICWLFSAKWGRQRLAIFLSMSLFHVSCVFCHMLSKYPQLNRKKICQSVTKYFVWI